MIHSFDSATLTIDGRAFPLISVDVSEPRPMRPLRRVVQRRVYSSTATLELTPAGRRWARELFESGECWQREVEMLERRLRYPGGRKARSAVRRLRRMGVL